MKIVLWRSLVVGLGCLIPLSSAYAQEVPRRAGITGWRLSGDGCSAGNSSVTISPDFKDISVLYDSFRLEIGQGTSYGPVSTARVRCILDFDVSSEPGWQFAFRSADYRGFVVLPQGAQGLAQFAYAHTNGSGRAPTLREVRHAGAVDTDFLEQAAVSPGRESWSRCGGAMTVRLQAALSISYPRGERRFDYATYQMDSTDATLQGFKVIWRRCR